MLDLLIKGGMVVTPGGVGEFDVGIQGEKIVMVSGRDAINVEAQRTIDATGKYVLPGGIEPHTHIATSVSEAWAGRPGVMTQSPEAASRAAAFGGVTTFIDFAGLCISASGRFPLLIDGAVAPGSVIKDVKLTDGDETKNIVVQNAGLTARRWGTRR